MGSQKKAKSALLSVYDKAGIVEFARFLSESNWNIISTGGTAAHLRENGLEITDVSEKTGFPECLDGRVKTLHPAVHAAILAKRSNKQHRETLEKLKLETIDLVCVNLYPFFEKVKEGLNEEATIEFIDIGGPTMLRSAAKNFNDVIVVTDPRDYKPVMEALKTGGLNGLSGLSAEFKKSLAAKVFALTSTYDAAIYRYLINEKPESALASDYFPAPLLKKHALRYGENAHQKAALFSFAGEDGAIDTMEFLNGKELSYNNVRDLDLAWQTVCGFGLPSVGLPPIGEAEARALGVAGGTSAPEICCVAVKHCTPCGIALGGSVEEAFDKAFACDPVSIFGGIVAFNGKVTARVAEKLNNLFLEIIIAPDYDEDALKNLRLKKNLRVIRQKFPPQSVFELSGVEGGILVQERSAKLLAKWEVVTKSKPDKALIPDLLFGLRSVQWVRSNGIVAAIDGAAIGIGGGETSRISAAELALKRAKRYLAENSGAFGLAGKSLVLASDAFFPFPDVVEAAAAEGVKAIIQSGGSNNDAASVEACDKLGISMVLTGIRYFKH